MCRDCIVPNVSGQVRDIRSPVTANFLSELSRVEATNSEAARALGVSERQITRWRGGQVPSWEFVVRMGRYFGRPAEWFFADHSPKPSATGSEAA